MTRAPTSPEPRAPTRSNSAMQVDRPPGRWQAPRASDSSSESGDDLRMFTNTQLNDLKKRIKIQKELSKRLEYKEVPVESGV